MAIVELDKIRKAYDTKVAVEGLSLKIEAGTMFGLLGPNGSRQKFDDPDDDRDYAAGLGHGEAVWQAI